MTASIGNSGAAARSSEEREGERERREGASQRAREARETRRHAHAHTRTRTASERRCAADEDESERPARATLSCSSYKPTTYACVACCVCSRCAAPPETNLPASGSAGLACKGITGPIIALLLLSRRPSASSQIFPAAPAATRGRASRLRASRRRRHELDTLRVLLQESESGLSGGRGKESAVPIGNP